MELEDQPNWIEIVIFTFQLKEPLNTSVQYKDWGYAKTIENFQIAFESRKFS